VLSRERREGKKVSDNSKRKRRRGEGGRGSSRFERALALADPEKTEDTVELFIKRGRKRV
jgi:hypothetical protein